jgi:hypothetical protein
MTKDHPTAEPDEDEYGKVNDGSEPKPKAETHQLRGKPEGDAGSSSANGADISGPKRVRPNGCAPSPVLRRRVGDHAVRTRP